MNIIMLTLLIFLAISSWLGWLFALYSDDMEHSITFNLHRLMLRASVAVFTSPIVATIGLFIGHKKRKGKNPSNQITWEELEVAVRNANYDSDGTIQQGW